MGENKIFTKLREVPVTKNAALKTRMTKSSPMSSPRGSSRDTQVGTVAVANEHPTKGRCHLRFSGIRPLRGYPPPLPS